ncbi:NolY [Bradyrhizobium erythrophlei]|uniref:NolY n=1 Tax=Bradyrhizobium erythrophlei TaxID=1437360 RepID=UPI0035E97943
MDFDRCNSEVQHLGHSIDQKVEDVAGLICQDKTALEAIQLLNTQATALGTAELERDRSDETGIGGELGDRRTEQVLGRHGGVFYPEDLRVLGRLFEQTVAALPAAMQTSANRTTIAKLILAGAVVTEGRLAFDAVDDTLCLCQLIRQTANTCSCSA